MRILDIDPTTSSRVLHRSWLPGRYCREALEAEGIEVVQSRGIPRGEFYDAYVVHGFVDRPLLHYLDAVQALGGRRIAWELDDNIWQLPGGTRQVERARQARPVVEALRGMVDLIMVSTDELARFVNWPEKTIVCPNLVEPDWLVPRDDSPSSPIRVVWSGSWVHERDLESVADAVLQLAQEEDGRIEFNLMGGERLPRAFRNCSHIIHHRWQQFERYQEMLADLRPDILLAPLIDNAYNRAKTNIKWLEATCCGAAFIGTDLEPYRCVQNDVTGLLVSDGDWYGAVRRLVFDEAERRALVLQARKRVRMAHAWDRVETRLPWLTAFRRLADSLASQP